MLHWGGNDYCKPLLLLIACALFCLYSVLSFAAPGQCDQWIARIISVQGTIDARASNDSAWQLAGLNQTYCPGDVIRVHTNSRAAIELSNETVIRLDQSTTLVFPEQTEADVFWLDLIQGAIHVITRITRSLKIKTPYVNAAVEGTEFTVRVQQDQTLVSVIEGSVAVENDKGSLLLVGGQSAVTRKGEAPVLRLDIRPQDAVHWTLYYPSVLAIDGIKDNEVREKLFQAESLLVVGRVNDAEAKIDEILAADPDISDALALRSIIALVQNNKDQALELAQQAVNIDSTSISALVALSYALQAKFDLAGAISVIEDALRVSQNIPLVWTRYAELQLSLGDLDSALVSARHATALDPEQPRSLTVLGFAYLSQFKVAEAIEVFNKAIIMDQADPLPRLGLGLALIRRGGMEEGRREIEIATTLDPNNALMRSYLGKAYYEEKRDRLAADQFALSKALDPLDPTPWFYNAILKQSQNRPIEALADLQQSIELNNNRAVYRSRLMLDQDLAARSSSLARIYNDLGFQQLALVEGWKSVNTDIGNHSAHRFLADSYAALPRHEIARVSELLQSQLLQPINLNPIQPQLAESSLGILDGTGPSESAFNEFNPLFIRDQFALGLNGIIGGNSTRGDDFVHTAILGTWSYSLGQFHYESDGFRPNNDQEQDLYNVFVQTALSHKTSVQFEYRQSEITKGDLPLRNDPADFNNTLREQDDRQITRLGLHHKVSPVSRILVSAISSDIESAQQETNALFTLNLNGLKDASITEIQYQIEGESYHLVAGTGNFKSGDKLDISTGLNLYSSETKVRHNNAYVYAYLNPIKDVSLATGLSWDVLEDEYKDGGQINPKVGLVWDVSDTKTIRLAAFRALKRNLIANQTLEPTQIAGFNQFFDDPNSTDSRSFGIALDNKINQDLYSGVEVSRRNMDVSFTNTTLNQVMEAEWQDDISRAYLYWVPSTQIAASIDYQYEHFRRPEEFAPFGYTSLITHQLPIAVNLFYPSGMAIKLRTTFVDQQGAFFITMPSSVTHGGDQFWVMDIEIDYRFLKRLGKITLGVKNVLDRQFRYHDTDVANPQMIPEAQIFSRFSLSY